MQSYVSKGALQRPHSRFSYLDVRLAYFPSEREEEKERVRETENGEKEGVIFTGLLPTTLSPTRGVPRGGCVRYLSAANGRFEGGLVRERERERERTESRKEREACEKKTCKRFCNTHGLELPSQYSSKENQRVQNTIARVGESNPG